MANVNATALLEILKYQLCLAANALTVMGNQENKNAKCERSDTDSSGCGPGSENNIN